MKNYSKYFLLIFCIGLLTASCDYIKSPDDTESVSEGFITYPALTLIGDAFTIIEEGGEYTDPGFIATLGQQDLSDQVEVTGSVDPSTAGAYTINYSVTIVNELDEEASSSATRTVFVRNSSEIAGVDLAGQYQGAGFGSQIATVVNNGDGTYTIDKLLASGNNISATFHHLSAESIAIADQPGPFGNMNTTNPGTSGAITGTGFQWVVFIGCCGNFGPITFDKL